MTASEVQTTSVKSGSAPAPPATNPYIGIVGVFLGAGLATLNGRLVGIGLARSPRRKRIRVRRSVLDSHCAEYGHDVQRSVRRFCQLFAWSTADIASVRRYLYAWFRRFCRWFRVTGQCSS